MSLFDCPCTDGLCFECSEKLAAVEKAKELAWTEGYNYRGSFEQEQRDRANDLESRLAQALKTTEELQGLDKSERSNKMQFVHRRLDFKEPCFNEGLNYTVRLGRKWADLSPGDVLDVGETDGGILGKALVRHITVSSLRDVPTDVLRNEHAPDARDYPGLYQAMERAYGEDKIEGSVIVTSIGFDFCSNYEGLHE